MSFNFSNTTMRPERKILEQHKAYYKYDTDFAAYARLLQSRWREDKGYKHDRLGNFLSKEFAQHSKSNYLTDKIKTLVQYEVFRAKVEGKLISEPRIWNNLLSSQPLCFNLFGELHFDLNLATKFFRTLFPDRIYQVIDVKFEYSPGRGNKKYSGDHSAFDVFVEYLNPKHKRGFVGIEVKYAENLKESVRKAENIFTKHQDRYIKLSLDSKLFLPSSFPELAKPPLQQIWRDHMLSIATQSNYEDGFFVFVYPSLNIECKNALDGYVKHLKFAEEKKTGFYERTLEVFINTLRLYNKAKWTKELEERYLGTDIK